MSNFESNFSKMIKKAISDGELTSTEYDQILSIAHEDGKIDSGEKALLSQLREMLADGTIKRVKV